MRKIISILCLTFLVFSMAMPTLSIASAAEAEDSDIFYAEGEEVEEVTTVNLGDDNMSFNGKEYIKTSDLVGPYDFEENAEETFQALIPDNGDFPVGNKKVADFETETGLTDDSHGKVIVYPGGDGNGATLLYSNSAGVSTGIFAVTFDILFTQGPDSGNNIFSFYTNYSNANGTYTNNTALRNAFKFGNQSFTYRGETIASFTNNQWARVAVLMDLDADMYHFIINDQYFGSRPVQAEDGTPTDMSFISQFRLFARGKTEGLTCLDNVAIYRYIVSFDAEIADTSTEVDSVWNIEFDVKMNSDTLLASAAPVTIVDENGDAVDIEIGQYDDSTNTLPITLKEKIRPGATLNAIIANTVFTAGGFSYNSDYIIEVSTDKTVFGVEEIDLGGYTIDTLPLDETISVDVNLRTEAAQDSKLVLVLYVDGALRSISAATIDAGSVEGTNTLTLDVPGEAGETYEIRAMLLGENYQLLDTIAVQ